MAQPVDVDAVDDIPRPPNRDEPRIAQLEAEIAELRAEYTVALIEIERLDTANRDLWLQLRELGDM